MNVPARVSTHARAGRSARPAERKGETGGGRRPVAWSGRVLKLQQAVGNQATREILGAQDASAIQAKAAGPVAAAGGGQGGGGNLTGIPSPVRSKMEAAFGADFSGVRMHPRSSRAAALGALAYTQGSEIHVAPGQWAPETMRGQELLGHELAHVVQQRQGRVRATAQYKGVALNDDRALEAEADRAGARAARASISGHPSVHRASGAGGSSGQLAREAPAQMLFFWPMGQVDAWQDPWSEKLTRLNADTADILAEMHANAPGLLRGTELSTWNDVSDPLPRGLTRGADDSFRVSGPEQQPSGFMLHETEDHIRAVEAQYRMSKLFEQKNAGRTPTAEEKQSQSQQIFEASWIEQSKVFGRKIGKAMIPVSSFGLTDHRNPTGTVQYKNEFVEIKMAADEMCDTWERNINDRAEIAEADTKTQLVADEEYAHLTRTLSQMKTHADAARFGLRTFRAGLASVTRLVDGLTNQAQKTMAVKNDQASRGTGSEEMAKGRARLMENAAGYDRTAGQLVDERGAFLSTSYRSRALSRQERAMSQQRSR